MTLSAAKADLVVVQEITGPSNLGGQQTRLVSYYKDDKARIDVGEKVSSIINGATGQIISLMHDQKMVTKFDSKQTSALYAMSQQVGSVPSAAQKISPTGKKDKINGFNAEEFVIEQAGNKITLWLARDYPNKEKLLKQLSLLQKSDALKFTPEMSTIGMDNLPGIPVRMISNISGAETTINLVSIQEKTLENSLFEIPANYKSLDIPGMKELMPNIPSGY